MHPALILYMSIIKNNHLISELETALMQKMVILNHHISEPNRYNISIRENELLGKKQSVVFLFKITSKYSYLEYCCPLTKEQHDTLSTSGYVPILRSEKYLKVGCEQFQDAYYAYANIRFPLERGGAMDFMTAFEYLHRELERFLMVLEGAGGHS